MCKLTFEKITEKTFGKGREKTDKNIINNINYTDTAAATTNSLTRHLSNFNTDSSLHYIKIIKSVLIRMFVLKSIYINLKNKFCRVEHTLSFIYIDFKTNILINTLLMIFI